MAGVASVQGGRRGGAYHLNAVVIRRGPAQCAGAPTGAAGEGIVGRVGRWAGEDGAAVSCGLDEGLSSIIEGVDDAGEQVPVVVIVGHKVGGAVVTGRRR